MEQKAPLGRMHKGRESRSLGFPRKPLAKGAKMGEIRVVARLENEGDVLLRKRGKLGRKKIRALNVDAIVDTGAVMTLLPQEMVDALGLEPRGKSIVLLANDQKIEMARAGGILMTIGDRQMSLDCLVGPTGCEPLIGQIVMECLDLIPDPVQRTLTPRPESPFRPTLKMKSAARPVLRGLSA